MNNYTIVIEDFEIKMFLGLHDFEKKEPQRVYVSVEVDVSLENCDYNNIFDYDKITDYMKTYNGKSIETQEELTFNIHKYILNLGCKNAKVYSRKPDIYKDCKSVGVIFSGSREQT